MAVSAAAAAAAGVERPRRLQAAAMAVGGRGTGEERAGWGLEAEAARGEGAKTVVVGRAESAVSGSACVFKAPRTSRPPLQILPPTLPFKTKFYTLSLRGSLGRSCRKSRNGLALVSAGKIARRVEA